MKNNFMNYKSCISALLVLIVLQISIGLYAEKNLGFFKKFFDDEKPVSTDSGIIRNNTLDDDELIDFNALMMRASYYKQTQRTDEAIEYYRKANDLDPEHYLPYFKLAELYYEKASFARKEEDKKLLSLGIKNCERAIELNPDFFDALDLQANIYLKKGEYTEAKELWENIIDINPKNTQVLIKLARAFESESDYEKAEAYYLRLPDADKYNPNVYWTITNFYKGRKNWVKALYYAEKTNQYAPQSIQATVALSEIRSNLNAGELLAAYINVKDIEPDNPNICFYLGKLYYDSERYSEAESELKTVLKLKPANHKARLLLADIYKALNNYTDAKKELITLAEGPEPEAAVFENLGAVYLDEKEISLAIENFQKAFSMDSSNLRIKILLAKAHVENGDNAAAIKLIEDLFEQKTNTIVRAIRKNKDLNIQQIVDLLSSVEDSPLFEEDSIKLAKLFYLKSSLLLFEKKTDEAIPIIEKAHEADPENYKALLLLSEMYFQTGKTEKSLTLINELSSKPDSSEQDIIRAAALLTKHNNNEEVVTFISNAFTSNEKLNESVHLNLYMALAYSDLEEWDKEIESLKKIIATNPSDKTALSLLGNTYFKTRNFPEAIEVYKTLAEDNPNDIDILLNLSRAYIGNENYELAIEKLELANLIDPQHLDVLSNLSFAYNRINKYSRAIEVLESYRVKNEKHDRIYYLIGLTYYEQKKYDKAVEALKKASELKPEFDEYFYWQGASYEKMGNFDKAVEALRKTIEINADNPDALNHLGYMYAERGENLDEAMEMISKALKFKPEADYILDSMGWVHFQKGNYEKAEEYLKKAISINPDTPDSTILEHLGDVYMKLNNKEKAREFYQKATETEPVSEKAKEKLEKLAE